jgi:hypothetical protein
MKLPWEHQLYTSSPAHPTASVVGVTTDYVICRSIFMRKQLERLVKAIEKRAACEHAIQKLTMTLSADAEHLAVLMNSVHTGRCGAVQVAAASKFKSN